MLGIDTHLDRLRDLRTTLVGDGGSGHAQRESPGHEAHDHHHRLRAQTAARAREHLGRPVHAPRHHRGHRQGDGDGGDPGLQVEPVPVRRGQVQDE